MKGSHEIRFGFDFLHHLMNHWQPELGAGPRGSFDFGNAVTSLNTAAIAAAGGFQGGTPSFENGWNGMAGFLLGTPTGSGKSSQFIKMDSLENVFGALHSRPLARHSQADAESGIALGAVPQPDALRRPGHRVVRSQHQRGSGRRARRHPAGQRSRLQQEALRTARRFRLSARTVPPSSAAATDSPSTRTRGARKRCAAGIP